MELHMRSRGFSLIEILVAMAIMVMLAGIVLPIGLSRLNANSFSATQRQLASAVSIARADSQRRGVLLHLVAVESMNGVAIWSIERPVEGDAEAPERRSFLLELPGGASLADLPREESEEEADADEERAEEPRGDSRQEGEGEAERSERTICVLMPDGTVVSAEPLVLVGRGGERARIDINPWTGGMNFPRLEPLGSLDDGPGGVAPEPGP